MVLSTFTSQLQSILLAKTPLGGTLQLATSSLSFLASLSLAITWVRLLSMYKKGSSCSDMDILTINKTSSNTPKIKGIATSLNAPITLSPVCTTRKCTSSGLLGSMPLPTASA